MRGIAFVPKLTKKRYWLPLDPLDDRFNRSSAPELEIYHEPCNDNSVSDSCLRLLDNRVLGKSWLDYGERVIAKLSSYRLDTGLPDNDEYSNYVIGKRANPDRFTRHF